VWSKQLSCIISAAVVSVLSTFASASAMSVKILGDQLILSGRVVDGDHARVKEALGADPGVRTAILRNSPGGHAGSGYAIGELFRTLGVGDSGLRVLLLLVLPHVSGRPGPPVHR
jgi:hypothetical protein